MNVRIGVVKVVLCFVVAQMLCDLYNCTATKGLILLSFRGIMDPGESMKDQVSQSPLFRFGVFSDIQWADIEDGWNFHHDAKRYYRDALEKAKKAIKSWTDMEPKPDFAIHFGDLIDGKNKKIKFSEGALRLVLDTFDEFPGEIYNMLGNHDLYNFEQKDFAERIKMPTTEGYYEFSPHPDFQIIVLNTYDISIHGYPKDHEKYRQAVQILSSKNKNKDWNDYHGRVGLDRRFNAFNGAIGEQQLKWFEQRVKAAHEEGKRIIICNHAHFHPKAMIDPNSLIWNYKEVIDIIETYSSSVVACFHGHDHEGGYHFDEATGVHHRVFESIIECPQDSNSFGHIDAYPDRLELWGSGCLKSHVMLFKKSVDV